MSTEAKTPQPGEWWFANDGSGCVYIVGCELNGKVVFQISPNGGVAVDCDGWSKWHHEPLCDGWGWQPKPVAPPFPSQEENPRGLHQKYIITHATGKPIDPKAVYFVLRLDGDHPHNQASRFAALEWADVIDDECEALKPVADELRVLVERLTPTPKPVEPSPPLSTPEPPIEQEVIETPPNPKHWSEREVSLYWYDGNVVGRYADCPPQDPSFTPLVFRDGRAFIQTEAVSNG